MCGSVDMAYNVGGVQQPPPESPPSSGGTTGVAPALLEHQLSQPSEATVPGSSITGPKLDTLGVQWPEQQQQQQQGGLLGHAHTHPDLCSHPQWMLGGPYHHPWPGMSTATPHSSVGGEGGGGCGGRQQALDSLGPPVTLPRTLSANAMGDMRDLRSGLHRSLKYSFWHRSVIVAQVGSVIVVQVSHSGTGQFQTWYKLVSHYWYW